MPVTLGNRFDDEDAETTALAWPGAARALRRNATILKAVVLVAFVCLSIVLCTAGIYLRSWELEFKIQELKDAPGIDPTTILSWQDYILISNQPDILCAGTTDQEWSFGPIEKFRGCEARQREDFTRSDKEIYEQCISTHAYDREKYCQRGKDDSQSAQVRILVFNVTNPADVVEGLTPRIREVGRVGGGPLVFYEDCRTFDTEFRTNEVEFSEHCYYTYKYPSTEAVDLNQQVITVNVGLMEAIGNSLQKIDYIVVVVWGTLALEQLNATTTTVEDYMRGQLLSFSWPNDFGAAAQQGTSNDVEFCGARNDEIGHELMPLEPEPYPEASSHRAQLLHLPIADIKIMFAVTCREPLLSSWRSRGGIPKASFSASGNMAEFHSFMWIRSWAAREVKDRRRAVMVQPCFSF
eukprot:g4178.t1